MIASPLFFKSLCNSAKASQKKNHMIFLLIPFTQIYRSMSLTLDVLILHKGRKNDDLGNKFKGQILKIKNKERKEKRFLVLPKGVPIHGRPANRDPYKNAI